jgi:hypothetical protein
VGRERAWHVWRDYCQNPQFKADCANVEYYKANDVNAQLGTSDFGEWWAEVHRPGSFGKLTSDMKKYYYHLAHIAVLWDEKIREFATNGMNLIVAAYGRQSTWIRPTYWRFSLRERNLDVRFSLILIRKMKEGWEGELTLPDARPYPKMIGYAESVSAMLSDGSNWVCTCGMINSQKRATCAHCEKPKPASLSSP